MLILSSVYLPTPALLELRRSDSALQEGERRQGNVGQHLHLGTTGVRADSES